MSGNNSSERFLGLLKIAGLLFLFLSECFKRCFTDLHKITGGGAFKVFFSFVFSGHFFPSPHLEAAEPFIDWPAAPIEDCSLD